MTQPEVVGLQPTPRGMCAVQRVSSSWFPFHYLLRLDAVVAEVLELHSAADTAMVRSGHGLSTAVLKILPAEPEDGKQSGLLRARLMMRIRQYLEVGSIR